MTSRFGCILRGFCLRFVFSPLKQGLSVAAIPFSGARRMQRSAPTFQMKPVATAGLLLVLCLASAAQESDTTFKVDVKLVNVFVTVTDEHGAPDCRR